MYNLNARRNLWEEAGVKRVDNMYSVTAMAWKQDGSRLTVGRLKPRTLNPKPVTPYTLNLYSVTAMAWIP